MYAHVELDSSGMLDQGPQKEKNCCYATACWIFQVLTWDSLATSVALFLTNSKLAPVFASFGVCYIVYIILEFCSLTAKYLYNKSSDLGMYYKMGKLFQTPPNINFYCECYHYVTYTYSTTDGQGNTQTHTRTEKVTNYTETY